ncbi:MAG: RHS repeat-associated core domain-containing protein, partial [Candidatus Riflebacteria bacterium]|nr:RHS repeat-associated core domain-containing protein [Candidatus Riflebacteria bacterium]
KLPKLHLYREFVSGPQTDDIEATRYHCRDVSMLKDALGSTIALTNRNGNLISKIAYDAWGNFRWPDKKGYGVAPCKEDDLCDLLDRLEGKFAFGGAMHDHWHYGRHFGKALTPYLYTGRRISPVSEQYFNRNRYYSPRYGRFITKDPIGFSGGNNLWNYAGNNPLIFVDPFGRAVRWAQMKTFFDPCDETQVIGYQIKVTFYEVGDYAGKKNFSVWLKVQAGEPKDYYALRKALNTWDEAFERAGRNKDLMGSELTDHTRRLVLMFWDPKAVLYKIDVDGNPVEPKN